MKKLHQGEIPALYLIMGVVDHYTCVKLEKGEIFFMDSLNTPMNELLNIDTTKKQNLTLEESRKLDLRRALDIIQEIYFENRCVNVVNAEMRAMEIIDSYRRSEAKNEVESWFKEQYAPQVIKNDLIAVLDSQIIMKMKPNVRDSLVKWSKEEAVIKKMGKVLDK